LLTGVPAGERDARGAYPAGSVHRRVADQLARFAKALKAEGPESNRTRARHRKAARA
jgi:hypothetical protein